MRPRATATPSHTSAQSRQSVLFAFGRNTSSRLRRGIMPLEIELPKVLSRPSVSFHLLPLANALQKANQTSKPTPNNTNKRKHEETQPTTPNAARPSKKGKGAGKGKKHTQGTWPNVVGKALETSDGPPNLLGFQPPGLLRGHRGWPMLQRRSCLCRTGVRQGSCLVSSLLTPKQPNAASICFFR